MQGAGGITSVPGVVRSRALLWSSLVMAAVQFVTVSRACAVPLSDHVSRSPWAPTSGDASRADAFRALKQRGGAKRSTQNALNRKPSIMPFRTDPLVPCRLRAEEDDSGEDVAGDETVLLTQAV